MAGKLELGACALVFPLTAVLYGFQLSETRMDGGAYKFVKCWCSQLMRASSDLIFDKRKGTVVALRCGVKGDRDVGHGDDVETGSVSPRGINRGSMFFSSDRWQLATSALLPSLSEALSIPIFWSIPL